MTKGQEMYVDRKTRSLLVDWCDAALRTEAALDIEPSLYLDFAKSKKWVSAQSDGKIKVLSVGFEVAARFLK